MTTAAATPITEAQVTRAVRGALKAWRAAGLTVGSVTTEISAGAILVTITAPVESAEPRAHDPKIRDLTQIIKARHARRS